MAQQLTKKFLSNFNLKFIFASHRRWNCHESLRMCFVNSCSFFFSYLVSWHFIGFKFSATYGIMTWVVNTLCMLNSFASQRLWGWGRELESACKRMCLCVRLKGVIDNSRAETVADDKCLDWWFVSLAPKQRYQLRHRSFARRKFFFETKYPNRIGILQENLTKMGSHYWLSWGKNIYQIFWSLKPELITANANELQKWKINHDLV